MLWEPDYCNPWLAAQRCEGPVRSPGGAPKRRNLCFWAFQPSEANRVYHSSRPLRLQSRLPGGGVSNRVSDGWPRSLISPNTMRVSFRDFTGARGPATKRHPTTESPRKFQDLRILGGNISSTQVKLLRLRKNNGSATEHRTDLRANGSARMNTLVRKNPTK